ncbi:MOSC domain-containing protein [Nonomuraea angiospora]|uniref:MOSC domain-containing protein n=1 Tax=Nonomuraea angiospora TaxID=46172 RepID=UPI0029B790F0|nr:MOSC domain-containing protein [Nonomuraea angiospora]MDX3107938.1 MOSC domain-containing protein [Nonomuraea angiospora]
MINGRLLSLNIGAVGVIHQGDKEIVTAYNKSPVAHPLHLAELGFPGDEHVYEAHGGPDKSVCVYPHEHYEHWISQLGVTMPPAAAFGENFTVTGLLEREVHIGDVFAVGEALVQVTQPRSPCYKIAARYGKPKMAMELKRKGFTGYMMRTVREGLIQQGQALELVSREGHGITVAEANRILHVDVSDLESAARLHAVASLGVHSRKALSERLANATTASV